jgi:ferredoxin
MTDATSLRRVTIDPDLCTGHGRCYRLAPDIFEPNEEDRGRVKLDVVGADKWEALDRAVKLCPEQAICAEPIS